MLGPRGGPGVGAWVAARGRRPEAGPREVAAVPRRLAAPVRPSPGPAGRSVVRTPVPVPRGGRPRPPAQSTPEVISATPTSYPRAGVRRSWGSKIRSVHIRKRSRRAHTPNAERLTGTSASNRQKETVYSSIYTAFRLPAGYRTLVPAPQRFRPHQVPARGRANRSLNGRMVGVSERRKD